MANNPLSHLDSALETLKIQQDALALLASSLDGDFSKAVDRLKSVEGRVIVTGMGKSGHIARKIAATLASTGTPAYFVHPAEASHGDLGMITPADAVIALSKSGESAELADLIEFTRRFAVPMISITVGTENALARAADVALALPDAPEACPNGLAPTTSTTLSLVMGDALAIALMRDKGFTDRDFGKFHPGGKLGAKLLKVSDLMHGKEELPLVYPDTKMADAILVMTEKRFGCVGVQSYKGDLMGIITDGDLRRKMDAGLLARTAEEIMTTAPRTVGSEALAAEALQVMNAVKITGLFVVEDGKPKGILHIHDLLRAGVV